jgi:hypothetical protein
MKDIEKVLHELERLARKWKLEELPRQRPQDTAASSGA